MHRSMKLSIGWFFKFRFLKKFFFGGGGAFCFFTFVYFGNDLEKDLHLY